MPQLKQINNLFCSLKKNSHCSRSYWPEKNKKSKKQKDPKTKKTKNSPIANQNSRSRIRGLFDQALNKLKKDFYLGHEY